MMDINSTLPMFDSYLQAVHQLVSIVGIFVGGIFGFYILSLIWQVYSFRKSRKILDVMRRDMGNMVKTVERLEKKIDKIEREK